MKYSIRNQHLLGGPNLIDAEENFIKKTAFDCFSYGKKIRIIKIKIIITAIIVNATV